MSNQVKKKTPTWALVLIFLFVSIGLINCIVSSPPTGQDETTQASDENTASLEEFSADREAIIASIEQSISDKNFEAAIVKAQPYESLNDPDVTALLVVARVEVENQKAKQREIERLAPFDWRHSDSFNEFDNVTTKFSTARSLNSANFEFPYQGTNHLTVMFRKKGRTLEAMLTIDKGQFSCGYRGCNIRLRVGDGNRLNFSATEAANGVSDTIFIDNPTRLYNTLKAPGKFMIQADFYRYSNTVFNFETSTKLEI